MEKGDKVRVPAIDRTGTVVSRDPIHVTVELDEPHPDIEDNQAIWLQDDVERVDQ